MSNPEHTIYRFTDVACENLLCLGPGGISWFPIPADPEDADHDAFAVLSWLNAASFRAWVLNEHECHCKLLALADLSQGSSECNT